MARDGGTTKGGGHRGRGRPGALRATGSGGRRSVRVIGLRLKRFGDVYHRLLTMGWGRFLLLAIALYLGVNLLFGGLYLLQPGSLNGARPGSFEDAFFFSVQTLGTIGYGAMTPRTPYANLLVAVQAFVSLAVTAVATGLIFARISRPTARVMFSKCAVITALNGEPTLMFRAGNRRANQILEAEVSLNLARRGATQEGVEFRGFFELKPVRARSPLFALSWTIMHVIDEHSPLHGATPESLQKEGAEIVVVLSGVDETFAQRVHARYSYLAGEIVFGRRMRDILSETPDGGRVIDYTRFHDLEPGPDGG